MKTDGKKEMRNRQKGIEKRTKKHGMKGKNEKKDYMRGGREAGKEVGPANTCLHTTSSSVHVV